MAGLSRFRKFILRGYLLFATWKMCERFPDLLPGSDFELTLVYLELSVG